MKWGKVFLLVLLFAAATSIADEIKKENQELYRNLDLFTRVLNFVQSDYVEKVDEKELLYGAIRGMLATLDPHSAFLPADFYEELKVDTEGRFGGVGLEITLKDNLLTVISPIEGSPADRAGIREGDRILKIDGKAAKEISLTDAVRSMRGRKGTKIQLTISREGLKEPFDVTLTRDMIRIQSVRSERLEGRYGYIRIISFQEGTHSELTKLLRKLKAESKFPLQGLVLDLRNNAGGLLDEAISVTDTFLKEGTIVSTMSREKEIDKREARDDGNEPSFPIIVLVNGGSASAAEIVAGAFQDHKRAILLGTPTFGKGSVQTIYELGQGAALKLTVARYYTPSGRSIQAEGIQPDIVVESRAQAEAIKLRERFVRERDLSGHLESEKEKKPNKGLKQSKPPAKGEDDFQKEIALNYLKSWEIFRQHPAEGSVSAPPGEGKK